MDTCQEITIKCLLIASLAALIIPFLIYLVRKLIEKKLNKTLRKSSVSGMLIFSACLIVSVWCLRYSVGYFTIIHAEADVETLTLFEEIFNSILHSLQTFSMDEQYTEYLISGKNMLVQLGFTEDPWGKLYGIYASVLNIVAPIAGGAIILEIISSIFPKIKLIFSYGNLTRRKYCFFSELNAASLALAKNIKIENSSENPRIIFTDTYIDDENEKEYELFLEAKKIGAICVRDDLEHVKKLIHRSGKCEYYLMDENEFGNLQTLTALVKKANFKYIKNSHIYLFVKSDAYVQIEKQVNLRLDDAIAKKQFKGKKPMIIPVYGYRNLIQNLFVDVPLYEPLIRKTDDTKLTVTILGNGIIGTEAFLSAYWLGQMMVSLKNYDNELLKECDLTINVVSKDTEKDFWAKIDYVNPDIRKTVEVNSDFESEASEKYLAFNENGEKNNPYCKVRYVQADLKIGNFWDDMSADALKMFDSDYFVVALGTDSDNISIAENLRCHISQKYIEAGTEKNARNAVIAYAVFDSELSAILNNEKHFKISESGKANIYMHAFGNLEQVYSCKNIYISKNKILSAEAGNAYLNSRKNDSHHQDNKNRIKSSAMIDDYENSNYNYWANIARAMHVKYKVFSLGWIDTSVFDYSSEKECEKHRQNVSKKCLQYLTFAAINNHDTLVESEKRMYNKLSADYKKMYDDLEQKKEWLAWLEHRRWCAFTRTMGYRYVDAKNIKKQNGKHKDMRLKLHACLVEAGLPDTFEKKYMYDCHIDDKDLDCLDLIALYMNKESFKTWDYHEYENKNFRFESNWMEELQQIGIPDPEKYCRHSQNTGAICCHSVVDNEYLIPIETIKGAIEKKYRNIPEGKNVKCLFEFDKIKYTKKSYLIFATITQTFCKKENKNV